MTTSSSLVAVVLVGIAVGCGAEVPPTGDTQEEPREMVRERAPLPPAVVAQLDSGNAAYEAGDHQGALRHYTRATEISADAGAAWFGIYMAQQALGDDQAAQAALERAQASDVSRTPSDSVGR